MSNKIYIKTLSEWVDVSSYVHDFRFQDQGRSALNKLSVAFRKEIITTSENPTYEKEIRFENNSIIVFGGRINQPIGDYPYIDVICYSYGQALLDQFHNETYENTTPEAIFQDVVESADLTYASTVTTGITIDKVTFKDKKKSEVISWLCDLTGYSFYTDHLENAYFELTGEVSTELTLEVGKQIIKKPIWKYNGANVVNKVIVEGDFQEFNTNESDAGPTSEVTLTYEPSGDIRVTENGNELTGKVEGSNTGDYIVDRENKKIIFDSSQTNLIIYYSYKIPIRVVMPSQTTYSTKEAKIKSKSIKSYDEARKIGQKFISINGLPKKAAKLKTYGFDPALKSARTITIIDNLEKDASGTSINESLVINKIDYKSDGTGTVEVGSKEDMVFDWQKRVEEKLRELEQQDTNLDIIQQYRYWVEELGIDFTEVDVTYTRTVNDSWIWGQAIWGTTRWGDRREGDDFLSYEHGNRSLDTYWSITGTGTLTGNKFNLSANGKAIYKGRDTGTYSFQSGKVLLQYNKLSSTHVEIFLNETVDSGTYTKFDIDHSTGSFTLSQKLNGTESEISSTSYTWSGTQTINLRLSGGNYKAYTDTVELISGTYTTGSGTFGVKAIGSNAHIIKVEIYTGV
jgi:hypothetical protein